VHPPPGAALSSGRLALAPLVVVLCGAPFLVVFDSNAITVALPAVRRDLAVSRVDLQWVIAAYALSFGGALLIAGRAGDLYGRRRLLLAGLLMFSTGSAASAVAPTILALIIARAAQGLGAALAFPSSLALIAVLFEEGRQRTRVLGLYGAVLSLGFVAGVLAGGLLTSSIGWRVVVLLGALLASLAALGTWRLVPADRQTVTRMRLDVIGAVLLTASVLAVLVGVRLLWTDARAALACAPVCAALAWATARSARRRTDPLIPPRLLQRPTVRAACLAAFLTVGAGVGAMFMLSLHLQEARGYSPFESGWCW
jgi:MFS family permease